jgi:hypothetical protein
MEKFKSPYKIGCAKDRREQNKTGGIPADTRNSA